LASTVCELTGKKQLSRGSEQKEMPDAECTRQLASAADPQAKVSFNGIERKP